MNRKIGLVAFAASAAMLYGCGSSAPSAGASDNASGSGTKGELHIALAPSEDAEKMANGFEGIRAQLAKDTGLDVKVDKVTDYTSVIEAQRAGKVDVAWYGPLSMVLANQEAGATRLFWV